MVLLLLSVCGHKGFPAITLALVDRSSEFLMQKTWPPHAILVSEWPIYKKYPSPSETTVPIQEPSFAGIMFIMSSTKFSHFILIGEKKLSATCNSYRSINKNNLLLLKLLCQLEPSFTGMMFIMSSTKFSHFILIGEKNVSATCNSYRSINKNNLLLLKLLCQLEPSFTGMVFIMSLVWYL
jgi:hypothetical protein